MASRTPTRETEEASIRETRQNVLIAALAVFFTILLVIGRERALAIVGLVALAVLTIIVARHRRASRR